MRGVAERLGGGNDTGVVSSFSKTPIQPFGRPLPTALLWSLVNHGQGVAWAPCKRREQS